MSEYARRPRHKYCAFCKDKVEYIDYKDAQGLRKFVTDRGKIKPRRVTGTCAQHQHDCPWPSSGPVRWHFCRTRFRSSVAAPMDGAGASSVLSIWTDIELVVIGAIGCLAMAFVIVQVPYLALFRVPSFLRRCPPVAVAPGAFLAGATAAATGCAVGAAVEPSFPQWLSSACSLRYRVSRPRESVEHARDTAAAYAVAFVAVDVAGAFLAGESFIQGLRGHAGQPASALGAAGSLGLGAAVPTADTISETLFTPWPATYAATAFVTALMVITGVSRVSRSDGAKHVLPPLSKIDLSPLVLLLPIAGVSLLVAGELM